MSINGDIENSTSMTSINSENQKNIHEFKALLIGDRKKVLEFGTDSQVTKFLKDRKCDITRLKINGIYNTQEKEYADRIIQTNLETMDLFQSLGSEKYQVILIGDFLSHVTDPIKFLKKLHNFITLDGYIVCSIPNIAYGKVRLKLLNGEFNSESIGLSRETTLRFFTLDSIISTLENSSYSIMELCRVTKDFAEYETDYSYVIPEELVDAIHRDPESNVIQYVFKAVVKSSENLTTRQWLMTFPRTVTTERLKELFEYYKTHFGGELLKQIEKKDAHIASMQSAIKDKDAYIASMQSAIKDKDAHIASMQSAIKDKDAHIASMQSAIKDKDAYIASMEKR